VLDTGDIGTYGEPIEANITKLVDDVPVPYIFVPGNHDSPLLEREMGRVDNVRVLLHGATRVKGIRILGWGDPWFSESHDVSFDEGLALKRNVGELVARSVRRTRPDVLAVHDKRLAEPSYGNVPLVLSGHYHERQEEEVAGTRILAVGSTGATGLKSFALDTDQSYEAEVLYFRRSRAVAMDYITLTGFGEDFLVQRTTLEPVPSDKEEAATD
jgi:hypothetical protein